MIHQLFERIADLHSEKIALSYQNKKMTYEQLNLKSNQLANWLIKSGVVCENNIAIMMERSFEMVISILAVLKLGGTYVPIDPEYPNTVIEYIIRDSAPQIILTSSNNKYQSTSNVKFVYVDVCNESDISNPGIKCQDDALAYIIYTSGSTGKPKGVMVEHRNVINLFNAVDFNFTPNDIWVQYHSISFDFSVWELFGSLLSGATLVIVPNNISKNFREFRKLLIDNRVTILNQVPSAFYSLQIEEMKFNESKLSLTHIIFGGERLIFKHLSEWKNKYQKTKLINMYGITETTVHATYKEITENDINIGVCNIGRVLSHLNLHLLNENRELTPMGEVGEISIEGTALARGYLNNDALTNERFIYCYTVSNNRIYCSGDLGRFLPNGELEYIGRIDNQVKVRGHRIELEEIEFHLNQYGMIKQSVVIALDVNETDKVLEALYTSDLTLNQKDICDYLSLRLPKYMVPVIFKRVENFIQTANGKIDRKRVLECIEIKTDEAVLQTSIYDELTDIQKRAIEVIVANFKEKALDNISLDTNLSSVGLDSISFIKTIVALETEFDFEFDDEMLLITKFPTIKTMIEYVESKVN